VVQGVDLVAALGSEARVDQIEGARLEKWDTGERSSRGIDGIEPCASSATPPLESSDLLNGCAVREPPFLRTSSRAIREIRPAS